MATRTLISAKTVVAYRDGTGASREVIALRRAAESALDGDDDLFQPGPPPVDPIVERLLAEARDRRGNADPFTHFAGVGAVYLKAARISEPEAVGGLPGTISLGVRGALLRPRASRRADFHQTLGWDVDLGAGTGGGVVYDLTILGGPSVGTPLGFVALLTGGSLSGVSGRVPIAFQLPLALVFELRVGARTRVSIWARTGWVFWEDARQAGAPDAPILFGADELALGVGVAWRRLFVGAVIEERMGATSTALTLGTPLALP